MSSLLHTNEHHLIQGNILFKIYVLILLRTYNHTTVQIKYIEFLNTFHTN